MFSSRLPRLAVNQFSRAVTRLRAAGAPLLDLTLTNPTAAGLAAPPAVLSALTDPAACEYTPDPRGARTAREAIAARAAARGRPIDPDRLLLTASTSEAYSLLFKLLCDPGDEVLVPQPSYPLFDLLTRLDGVAPVPYRLRHHEGWSIDRASVEAALSPRSRAILVVSPNNPTGSMLRAADRDWLVRTAADRGLAVIADEVFAAYPLAPRPDAVSCLGQDGVLTFTLDGLSKSAGLPQMKLAWIAVSGPAALVAEAADRLETIADTYLSVSTPIQTATAALLAAGDAVRSAILERITRNLAALRAATAGDRFATLLEPEGGWAAVISTPFVLSDERLVLDLLEEEQVIVHPGYFFDFSTEGFLVMSLLPAPSIFEDGLTRVLRRVRAEPIPWSASS